MGGFSRGQVLRKILQVEPPEGAFKTSRIGDREFIDVASYRRYDDFTAAVVAVDIERLVSTFHSFRPILEQAYGGLGYPPEDFDNALIRALDQVIATPVLDEPIAVKRKEAVYIFVDPALEELSPLQKQLLRMGPDNVVLIKQQAASLRAALLGG